VLHSQINTSLASLCANSEFIVRDYNGQVHAAASFSLEARVNPVVAKAFVALRATAFCHNRGLVKIILSE
jgi:hypothetical protein